MFSSRARIIFNTPRQVFFIKSARKTFFVLFVSYYQQTVLATFYLILVHLTYLILLVFLREFNCDLATQPSSCPISTYTNLFVR